MRRALFALLLACVSDAQPCNPSVIAIGDSRTADRGDGQTNWTLQVTKLKVADFAIGGRVWAQCQTDYTAAVASWVPMTRGVVLQCGVNDIIGDADGHALFNSQKAWVESHASPSNVVYWQNMPGFKTYDGTPSRLAARNNYNSDLATYCLSPATNVVCMDIATPLWDPADHDKLLGSYTIEGLHYTTAGHAVVATTFTASFH